MESPWDQVRERRVVGAECPRHHLAKGMKSNSTERGTKHDALLAYP